MGNTHWWRLIIIRYWHRSRHVTWCLALQTSRKTMASMYLEVNSQGKGKIIFCLILWNCFPRRPLIVARPTLGLPSFFFSKLSNGEYNRHVIKVQPSVHHVVVNGGYGDYMFVNKWGINRWGVKLDILWIPGSSTQYLTAERIYSEQISAQTFPHSVQYIKPNSTWLLKTEKILKITQLKSCMNLPYSVS